MIFALQEIIFHTIISSCIWWRLLATNHTHEGVDLLPGLRVCSNNWSPLLPTLCAFVRCWRCKASSHWVLLNLCWRQTLLIYGSTFLWRFSCTGFGHFVFFFPTKSVVLCNFSQQRVFPALVAAYCSSLFQVFSEELWALMLNIIFQYQSPQHWMCRWYHPLLFAISPYSTKGLHCFS